VDTIGPAEKGEGEEIGEGSGEECEAMAGGCAVSQPMMKSINPKTSHPIPAFHEVMVSPPHRFEAYPIDAEDAKKFLWPL